MKSLLAAACLAASALLPPAAQAAPALFINEGLCGVVDAYLNTVVSNDVKVVRTQGPQGALSFRCQAEGVTNNTGAAVNYNFGNTGLSCVVVDPLGGLRITTDWQATITPSGQAQLICRDRL